MRNFVRPLLALSLATIFGLGAHAYAASFTPTGFATDSYGSQLSFDSFNLSVRKRMETIRIGSLGQTLGRSTVNPDTGNYQVGSTRLGSDEAYAMAPSSRVASNSTYRRRQLDCVYYSGFTVWADLYQTWARQRSRGDGDGYRYRTFGPAIGVDWSSGGFTFGAATTYNWGKIKSRNWDHDRKLRTFALELYGQYNTDSFYVNGTLAYAHNRFRSTRGWNDGAFAGSNSDRYTTNAWNVDGEFGWKFKFSGLGITPHAGLRYFHDRHGSIDESGGFYALHANTRNYRVLEMPLGVNVDYEINSGGMIFVPRARFAWIPELTRRKGTVNGNFVDSNGDSYSYSSTSRRNRHGFNVGLGLEAKISNTLSAHIDYNCNFRSKLYEHHWNLGVGFTF